MSSHGAALRYALSTNRPESPPHCRANLLHSRPLEVFEDLGIVDELLEQGRVLKGGCQYANGRAFKPFRYGDVESPYPDGLAQSCCPDAPADARLGAVTFVHRFDSALNGNSTLMNTSL